MEDEQDDRRENIMATKAVNQSPRKPRGGRYDPARSVRISDEVWEKAKRRAAYEGVTVSHVMALLCQGYAEGRVNMPVVTVSYAQTEATPAAS
jgi:hypothetical protein